VCVLPFIESKQERLVRAVLHDALFLNHLPSITALNDSFRFLFTTSFRTAKEEKEKEPSYVAKWSNISQIQDIHALKNWIVHVMYYKHRNQNTYSFGLLFVALLR
jgi:hypothetical protein